MQQKVILDSNKQDKDIEIMRMIKQTAIKTQDLETSIMQIQSDIDQVEEDLRKSASFDEFRNLEKIVD